MSLHIKASVVLMICVNVLFLNAYTQPPRFMRSLFYTDSVALMMENNNISIHDKKVKWQPYDVQIPFPNFSYDIYGPELRVSIYRMDALLRNGGFSYTSAYKDSLPEDASYLSTSPILYYEELLSGYGFLRCHQSHLVNKKYVKSFIKNDGYFLLTNDDIMIPVSRQKKNTIRSALLSIG